MARNDDFIARQAAEAEAARRRGDHRADANASINAILEGPGTDRQNAEDLVAERFKLRLK